MEQKSARSIGHNPSESVKKEDNILKDCEAAVAKYYKDMANLEQRLKEQMDRRKKERAGIIKPGSVSSSPEVTLTDEDIANRGPSKYTLEGRDLVKSMKKAMWDISGPVESQVKFETKRAAGNSDAQSTRVLSIDVNPESIRPKV